MNTVHAFTEPTPERGSPAYVNVSKADGGRCVLTVRGRELLLIGSQQPASIELSPEACADMALALLDYYNSLPAASVWINGRKRSIVGPESITYERLLHEAGKPPGIVATVTFATADGRSGCLTAGQSGPLENGVCYNVMITGAA